MPSKTEKYAAIVDALQPGVVITANCSTENPDDTTEMVVTNAHDGPSADLASRDGEVHFRIARTEEDDITVTQLDSDGRVEVSVPVHTIEIRGVTTPPDV